MEEASTSETSVRFYQTTKRSISEGSHLQFTCTFLSLKRQLINTACCNCITGLRKFYVVVHVDSFNYIIIISLCFVSHMYIGSVSVL
jgi:hypothetical protein